MEDEKPIRIAHIMGKWFGGGVESVVMNYYRNIDKNKIQFDFICDNDSTDIPYKEIQNLGGNVILIPPYQRIFKYHKALKEVLKSRKYHIVHSHISTLSVFSLCAAWAAKVPIRIAHSHNTSSNREKKRDLIKKILRPFSKVFATDYMCCSELAGRWLFGNKTYNKGKVYLLNNAIDIDKYKFNKKTREEIRNQLGIKENTLVIGHIGRFVEQKNHEFLIDVFYEINKTHEDSMLLLAGQGELYNDIKNKVKKLGLDKNVKFLGQRKDADKLYQAFDIFVLPSLYEGLPVVGVEAQAAGLLCIFSNNMTKETKILESTIQISLSESAEEWAKILLKKYNQHQRKDFSREISNNGFDIKKEAIRLEQKYLDMAKINICHVVSALKSGGAENMIYNYIRQFDSERYNFFILYQYKASQKNFNELKEIGCNLKEICPKKINFFKNYQQTKKFLIRNKIDIVHCHMTLANFIPLMAAKRAGIKNRISHSHETSNSKNIIKKFFEEVLKKLTNHFSTCNIACGKEAGDFLYNKKPYYIINNAIDIEKYRYNKVERNKIRRKLNVGDDEILIGHVGRFIEVKNHEFMLNLMQNLRKYNKYKLIFIGSGELESKIMEEVKNKKLEKNIIFTGIIDNVHDYYCAMDLFILPSIREGLPFAALEAQASGLKCYFSDAIDRNCMIVEENVKMLPLNTKIWVNALIKDNKYKRSNDNIEKYFNLNKLNIKKEYIKLEKIYKEKCNE